MTSIEKWINQELEFEEVINPFKSLPTKVGALIILGVMRKLKGEKA